MPENLKEMREIAVVRDEKVQTPGASRNTSGEFKELHGSQCGQQD